MDQTSVLELARHAITIAFTVSLPILAVSLFVGLAVSIFQAVTQVQEMTLTFVPKMLGAALVIVFMGGWMLTTLVGFTRLCFEHAARIVG